jgi:hypothetical protein
MFVPFLPVAETKYLSGKAFTNLPHSCRQNWLPPLKSDEFALVYTGTDFDLPCEYSLLS